MLCSEGLRLAETGVTAGMLIWNWSTVYISRSKESGLPFLKEGNESTPIIFPPVMYKCNVICQLDRTTVYLDIWLGIVSGSTLEDDSGRRLAFECVGWVKQLAVLIWVAASNLLRAWKGEKRWRQWGMPPSLHQAVHFLLPSALWVSGLQPQTGTTSSALWPLKTPLAFSVL